MKKTLITLIVIVILALGGWYIYSSTQQNGPVDSENTTDVSESVATVNGSAISRADFEALRADLLTQQGATFDSLDAATQEELNTQVLNTLISQELIAQQVAQADIDVPEENISAQLSAIASQFEDTAAFEQALETEGVTERELRSQINLDLATNAYLEEELNLSALTATEDEVNALYEEVSAGQSEVPPLEEVYDQVEQLVLQQKQQAEINAFIEQLRNEAEIDISI